MCVCVLYNHDKLTQAKNPIIRGHNFVLIMVKHALVGCRGGFHIVNYVSVGELHFKSGGSNHLILLFK